ncbi:AfsR/SARP family transcriptional regulator [Streptomyces sp. NPDC007162]|uniref:AfsR/SARP family transcriptional regulator n=1 Tax=Streptomyces sp. NPDC007162 TaxID=3156917 RepID=UPI0034063ED0
MHVNVLGTLSARIGKISVHPTALKQRRVLALLAVSPGMVSNDQLIEEIWEEAPPKSAVTALQTYVLALRKRISDAGVDGKRVLVTRDGGYQIRLADGGLDARVFGERVQAGHRLAAARDFQGAVDAYRTAESLWRGGPFTDVSPGPLLAIEAARLEEMRIGAIEGRIEAELRLGRHRSVVSELSALTAQHPLHEHLHAQYMLALHRSGRRDQALAAYSRVRTSLRRELGVEPSPRLWHLQRDVLMAENLYISANEELGGYPGDRKSA